VTGSSVVVVGAGLAGAHACQQLRARGFHGDITLVGDETHLTYDRPPLSKDVLVRAADRRELPIAWDELGIQRRLGESATGLRPDGARWVLEVGSGEAAADRVIIATGARPRTIPGAARHGAVLCLRTWEDATALRQQMRPGAHVLVVGAGWIGAEVASSAAALGCAVTVVEAGRAPLEAALGPEVGAHFGPWYLSAGVRLLTGTRITGFAPGRVLVDGRQPMAADVVVTGVGVAPNTRWLADSAVGLADDSAVLVDEHLQTTAPGVYAVGDCASYPSRRYGIRLRPEHWTNAQQAGSVVADNMTGEPTRYDPVPYFWSSQFGRMVQYCGHHRPDAELLWRGDPGGDRWAACWLDHGQLTAVLTVGLPRECGIAARMLASRPVVDRRRLADRATPLTECLAEP
jgi:NADPH-dependent 2,4-dienoyl-CoA reductase/sulfur reductase-like enzyme